MVYCPDQLGPAVDRLLTVRGLSQVTFPRAIGPKRVDWIDYKSVIAHTDVETFAQDALARLGPDATLWMVWNRGYAGFGTDCSTLETWFSYFQGAGTPVLANTGHLQENEILERFPTSTES